MRHRIDVRAEAGFTIIEVLVAIALFAIVVLVILAPLTGLFGLSQKSAQQTSATGLAQQAIEQIRGQWLDANRYGSNCVVGTLSATVTVQDEDSQGTAVVPNSPPAFAQTTATACPTTPASGIPTVSGPALRKITAVATVNGTISTLVVEVARP